MDLAQADKLSGEIVAVLAPHCAQIAVAGSIRRRARFPRDIAGDTEESIFAALGLQYVEPERRK